MIEQIHKFQNNVKTVVSAIFGVLSGVSIVVLKEQKSETHLVLILIAILLVIILQKVTEWLVMKLINNSIAVRRWILGQNFIEGLWVQESFLVDKNEKTRHGYSIITIGMVDLQYHLSGIVFDKEFELLATFHSETSTYKDFNLNYLFSGKSQNDQQSNVAGLGKMAFVKGNKFPQMMNGNLLESRHQDKIAFQGERIKKEFLTENELNNWKHAKQFLVQYYSSEGHRNRDAGFQQTGGKASRLKRA